MSKIDFKIFLRSLKKRGFNSAINLAGLSAGIACILLIAVYLNHELSFDQHQPNKDRTYRMILQVKTNSGSDLRTADNFIGLAHTLKNDFPEVEQAARIFPFKGDVGVKYKSGDIKQYKGNHIFRTEQEIFSVFDHHFIQGNPSKALSTPQSIVITESLARKYFGDVFPLNKVLILDNLTYKVTGVIRDLPKESDLYYEALTSFDFSEGFSFSNGNSDWGNPAAYTYVLLREDSDIKDFQSKLNKVVKAKTENFMMSDYDLKSEVHMYPQVLSGIHFEKPILSDTPKGNIVYINILIIVGVIIFLIVVFNYGNYTASYYTERIREISIRKHFGASKKVILKKIVSEMLFLSLAVLMMSIVLFTYFVPVVNELTNNAIGLTSLFNTRILMFISVIILGTTSIAILYPVTFLVGNKTLHMMTGTITPKGSATFRRSLLGVQFLCTTLLVFFSLTVYYQIQFLENKNLGFNSSKVLVIDVPEGSMADSKMTVFKDQLEQNSSIKNVSIASANSDPGNLNTNYQLGWVFQNAEKIEANFNFFEADNDFATLLDLKFLEGTDFAQSTEKIKGNEQVLVNESFIYSIGFKSPQMALGKLLYAFDDKYEIIGIVKNFHFAGIQKSIEPLVISNNSQFGYDAKRVLVKLNEVEGLAAVQAQFSDLNPNTSFDYKFMDEQFAQLFYQERTIGKMTNLFCLISVLLAGIGLYSISSLTLEQRAKEIGIRKILGAGTSSITILLGKEFLFLVLASFTVATPFAWQLGNVWLDQFAYRIDIGWFISTTSILIVGLVTISGICVSLIKGNNVNPADMLRTE
ncbi:ABC transporter permease [Fulvivirga maritima]|uniref:ABC transporter permease n=1 Tax=Fulvivirga maritima TaxID=2904247 RepID=UPI001F2A550B|nr:ABC transporter permease [Fulvivirga maritima]UII26138.1 ABC transporter permease [Fulvivirga maritima]